MKFLIECGDKNWLPDVIREMYSDNKVSVRINKILNECFNMVQVVRWGYVIFHWLFNIFMNNCMRRICYDVTEMLVGNINVLVPLYANKVGWNPKLFSGNVRSILWWNEENLPGKGSYIWKRNEVNDCKLCLNIQN